MATRDEVRALLQRLDGESADDIESEGLECKEWSDGNSGAKTLREAAVCFANGGGGTIVLGVTDKHKTRAEALTGVPDDIGCDYVRRVVYDGTDPHITVEAEELLEPEARLLLMHVRSVRPPYTTTEGVGKIRVGKECKPLTGSQIAQLFAPSGSTPIVLARKQLHAAAVALLRNTCGEMFRTSDGATSSLPGVLWCQRDRDWTRIVRRIGETDRQRGHFRPHVEPAQFDGSDEHSVQAAADLMQLYLWSSGNHPDFAAIRAALRLPEPEDVRLLLKAAASARD